jgi:hypothetical protein
MTIAALVLLAITSFGAASVNGALGYGYSSISVPIALFVVAGRILNPALVLIEVAINMYALWFNRKAAARVVRRVGPLLIGLVPGVVGGAFLLDYLDPKDLKLGAFIVLLPLILVQAAGLRWPIKRERTAAVPLGAGVGLLYGVTTISGPPLALFWNNQGFAKEDFKLSLAVVRTVESVCALIAYTYLGLVTRESAGLLPWLLPGVLIGVPVGHWMIRKVGSETFRRVCMSFDAYLVALGLSRSIVEHGVASAMIAYQLVAVTIILDAALLYRFFRGRRAASAPAPSATPPPEALSSMSRITNSQNRVPRLATNAPPQ